MPELPEVEVACNGLKRYCSGKVITAFVARIPAMKWPIDASLSAHLVGKKVKTVRRRAKFMLLTVPGGSLVLHLGMSGSIQIKSRSAPVLAHDHVDIAFRSKVLRLNDPRRFGGVRWLSDSDELAFFEHIGIEPLSDELNGNYIYEATRGRRRRIKQFLLDQHPICGIGNIYASEILFRAAIHPNARAGTLSRVRCEHLAIAIKGTLGDAIAAGGTTLSDFSGVHGELGNFQHVANVYGKTDEPCVKCGRIIRTIIQGRRSTFYCPGCQR